MHSFVKDLPLFVSLAVSKKVWVADVWDSMVEDGGWNPRFSWPFNDLEVNLVEWFLLRIQEKRVSTDMEDRVR